VDLDSLWAPGAQTLAAESGGRTGVQAERPRTVTTAQGPGALALTDVVSDATTVTCFDYAPFLARCANPWLPDAPRGGRALGSVPSAGVPAGTPVEYSIVVPKEGTYNVTYRATDRDMYTIYDEDGDGNPTARACADTTVRARIQLDIEDTAQTSEVCPGWSMRDVPGPTLELPAGTYTFTVSAPEGHEGWQLDWIAFTRLAD
jgi:hypothetical protein